MPIEHSPIMLEELAGGAAVDLFAACVTKIKQDIDNPNVKTDAKRSFDLNFSFEPDDKGRSMKISVKAKGIQLGEIRGATTSAYISHEHGQMEILEVQQVEMPMPDNVATMKGKADGTE